MSSWLTAGLGKLNELTEKVQSAIPVDKELLAKLTLNTDEMKATRQQFGDEAKRKAEVKDMLAGILPWETRDKEREILVEECKEAILALSSNTGTFFGPYEMPALKVKVGKNKMEKEEDAEDEEGVDEADGNDDDKEEEEDDDDDDDEMDGNKTKDRMPTEEDLEKLSKLEPLPPLLKEFDLDAHVGLIQKLLKEDPKLVKAQSSLSGGGARELVFWKNYFFHCAFTRYEAGLSIDEIWSFQTEQKGQGEADAGEQQLADAEETVDFKDASGDETTPNETLFATAETSTTDGAKNTETVDAAFVSAANASPSDSVTNEFELVGEDADISPSGDPELDELEAEIARELED